MEVKNVAAMRSIGEISGVVLAIILAFIFTGLGVYIVSEIGTQANISVLSTLSSTLGSWGTTWFPIILIVVAAAVIIGLLLNSFSGGKR
jgi:cadmium resistance protein CadD (predicted permease)